MKNKFLHLKMLIAGVGGQGIVYLTNILSEAAMLENIPVHVSEIHGLSQRGGIVTAGIGLGKYTTGFIGSADVDFLIGLEPLETQRCLPYLHQNSSVIFCNYRIAPYSVNAQVAEYPDIRSFYGYLKDQCAEVVFIENLPEAIDPVLSNVFLLGRATRMEAFPFPADCMEQAMRNTVMEHHQVKTQAAYNRGREYGRVPENE